MRIPAIRGTIDRRVLVNYRIDPDVMAEALPAPFRPQLVDGFAVGGICLIRLRSIRPRLIPTPWGLRSENAAHRIAVEWIDDGEKRSGVYIPRRDTNSRLNHLAGGRVFPGTHHRARFDVSERGDHYSIEAQSLDGETSVRVVGTVTDRLPKSSIFPSLDEASSFFEAGSIGYSATGIPGVFDGLELRCSSWEVEPLEVQEVSSTFFEDAERFPSASVEFDCALLMREIEHEWRSQQNLCCDS